MPGDKKVEVLDLQGLPSGGDSRTRTNGPIDVNDVLFLYSMPIANETQYLVVYRGFPGFPV